MDREYWRKGLDRQEVLISHDGDEEMYSEYLNTIFPNSVFREIVWHNSEAKFKNEGFKPMKPNFDTLNSIEGVYNFTTNERFAERYGNYSYPVTLDIQNPYEDSTSGEYVDDMDRPLSEALMIMGKQTDEGLFSPKHNPEHKDKDAVINTISGESYQEKHPVSGREFGIPSQKIVTVFRNSQIHILGSDADVEGFRKYQFHRIPRVAGTPSIPGMFGIEYHLSRQESP